MKRITLSLFCLIVLTAASRSEETPQGMVYVPAGEFRMGGNGAEDENPVHTVYLDAFYMDETEVTVGQFSEFLNEMGNQEEGGVPWLNVEDLHAKTRVVDGRFVPFEGFEDYPIMMVSWYGARAYSDWAEKRLPTEAEWEKAARGGIEESPYPWGEEESYEHGNVYGMSGADRWEKTSPVKSFPPNGYGLYDMAGNAWEWCADWYDPAYYERSPEKNPKGPKEGTYKVLRGGSWISKLDFCRVGKRFRYYPEFRNFNFGFRCARTP
jgi:formylglycine-generating enzyme required for sulfatase activity